MIRGLQKQMYYVRDTGSPMFAEAYFVLRSGGDLSIREKDLAAEADRIIREKFCGKPRRRRIVPYIGLILFIFGFVAGAALIILWQALLR